MISTIDGMIKSLTVISRYLKGPNQNAYRWLDNKDNIAEAERRQRSCGYRPAIISEDTRPNLDDIERNYKGEKGADMWRGAV